MSENSAAPIFVVGCARSGTTLMHQLIASHSQVVGVIETEILKKYDEADETFEAFVSKVARNDEERDLTLNYLRETFGAKKPGDIGPYGLLDAYCAAHKAHFNRRAYVEKSPVHSYFVGGLLAHIPHSRVIIVLRDPRAIVASRQRTGRISRGKAKHLPGGLQKYLNMSEVIFTFRELEQWFKASGECRRRLHFVTYEALVDSAEETMSEIFDFLGLPREPVHNNINPLDIRLAHRNRTGVMNSSFGERSSQSVSGGSVMNWTGVLKEKEVDFLTACAHKNAPMITASLFPELNSRRAYGIKGNMFNRLSQLDYRMFLRKNVKSLSSLA